MKGIIDGMACNETQCQKFSPAPEFSFKIEGAEVAANTETTSAETPTIAVDTPAIAQTNSITPDNIKPDSEHKLSELQPKDTSNDKSFWGLFIAGF
ncbi:MAG: hypothetical protein IPJ32_07945 [Sphingobacteriaceae bacterium]|nr:hypothetical protein [Sphingobacteriaceae bacterium]